MRGWQLVTAATNWGDVGSTVQSFVTAASILAGGIFAYFKFVKDRVYRPRVNLDVTAGFATLGDGCTYLMCRATVENLGSTKLNLWHDDTAIMVRQSDPDDDILDQISWKQVDAGAIADVFALHTWIESHESLTDEVAVGLAPDVGRICRVELHLAVRQPLRFRHQGISVSTTRLVLPTQTWSVPAG